MSMQERYEATVKKRDGITASAQRVQGKLDASRQQQQEIKAECQAKGLEPEQLAAAIEKLRQKYTDGVMGFERRVDVAGEEIAPYLGEV